MKTRQTIIALSTVRRGFHLVAREIERDLQFLEEFDVGAAHLHLLHTSASLSLNENTVPDVRTDLETILNSVVPDGSRKYTHTIEGPDDMAAHGKSSLIGVSILIPVRDGDRRVAEEPNRSSNYILQRSC